jgi:hypothetical protein
VYYIHVTDIWHAVCYTHAILLPVNISRNSVPNKLQIRKIRRRKINYRFSFWKRQMIFTPLQRSARLRGSVSILATGYCCEHNAGHLLLPSTELKNVWNLLSFPHTSCLATAVKAKSFLKTLLSQAVPCATCRCNWPFCKYFGFALSVLLQQGSILILSLVTDAI